MLLTQLKTETPTELVPVPEYGKDAEIMVRAMSAGEYEEYKLFGIKMAQDAKTGKYIPQINNAELVLKKLYFLAKCMVNEKMEPIATAADLQIAHNPGPNGPLDRCWETVLRLSGVDQVEQDADDLKKIQPAD